MALSSIRCTYELVAQVRLQLVGERLFTVDRP